MRRFYTNQELKQNTIVSLCEGSFHHWIRVLRAKVGDQAVLFNGLGGEYPATLTAISKKSAQVELGAQNPINRNNPFAITLAIVMSKGERMDFILQKATELGVSHIQLLTSERCEVKLSGERLTKKLANWQGIVNSACEQCGLNIVPTISAPVPFEQFTPNAQQAVKLVLAPTIDGQPNLPLPKKMPHGIALLIGAEGGLTDDEILLAKKHSFTSWCLGERILRTETAPIVAMSAILAHYSFTV